MSQNTSEKENKKLIQNSKHKKLLLQKDRKVKPKPHKKIVLHREKLLLHIRCRKSISTAKNIQFASHFFPSMLLGWWLDKLSLKAKNHLPGARSRRLLITVVERSRLQGNFLHLTFSRNFLIIAFYQYPVTQQSEFWWNFKWKVFVFFSCDDRK